MKRFIAIAALSLLSNALPSAQAEEVELDYAFNAAEEHYGAEEMRAARAALRHESGAMKTFFVMADRLEFRSGDTEDSVLLDGQGWYGGDLNKLWIKTEGEYNSTHSELEDAEVQLLWSHAITPFFDFQSGIRYDFEPNRLAHAVAGLQGLAPYWFEVDAAAFLSEEGDLTARVEVEYELLFTQRLILQRRAEIGLSAQDIPELGLGSGLTNLEAGLRLRYEIRREFAPYIGIEWTRAFGGTADYIEAAGGERSDFLVTAGLRFWF